MMAGCIKGGNQNGKACEVKWNVDKQRWTDADGILDSYEQDGKFYWTDGNGLFETSELIDLDEVFSTNTKDLSITTRNWTNMLSMRRKEELI